MLVLKIFLLFFSILSLVKLLEQLYLISIVVKNKGKVKDDGWARLTLAIVFSVCTALLVAFWDKF
jgi:hypothetical protein